MSLDEFSKYFYGDSIYWESIDTERIRNEISALYDAKTILFSREHLVHEILDTGRTAERIKFFFGGKNQEVKIVLQIRNQLNWLESLFLGGLRGYRQPWTTALPITNFDKFVKNALCEQHGPRGKYNGKAKRGDFGIIAKKYVDLFGKDNVGVFLFEDMVNSPKHYSHEFSQFLGVESGCFLNYLEKNHENARINRRHLRFWYWLAMLVPLRVRFSLEKYISSNFVNGILSNGPPISGDILHCSEDALNSIKEHFGRGNTYLENEFGLPLRKYGYPMMS